VTVAVDACGELQVSMPVRPNVSTGALSSLGVDFVRTTYMSGTAQGAFFWVDCYDLRKFREESDAQRVSFATLEAVSEPRPGYTILRERAGSVAGQPAAAYTAQEHEDGKPMLAEYRYMYRGRRGIFLAALVPESDLDASRLAARFVDSAAWVAPSPVSDGQVPPAAYPLDPDPRVGLPPALPGEKSQFVNGYFRHNGTYVQPYMRRPPR
jgi:hypothetical protein